MPPGRPKTPQLGAQDSPRAAQEAPKTPQEPSKSCPKGARETAQRCLGARRRPRPPPDLPKSSPEPLPTLILEHVGTDSHEMLYHSYVIFGGFGKVYSGGHAIHILRKLDPFSSILTSSLDGSHVNISPYRKLHTNNILGIDSTRVQMHVLSTFHLRCLRTDVRTDFNFPFEESL